VLGVIGLVEDTSLVPAAGFRAAGEAIILLGENKEELGGSEYLRLVFSEEKGQPPALNSRRKKCPGMLPPALFVPGWSEPPMTCPRVGWLWPWLNVHSRAPPDRL